MMSSEMIIKKIWLDPYQEVIGDLLELEEEDDGLLTARIGKVSVILPLDLAPVLKPHIGQRLAILKTDIPGKAYLYRILSKHDE